VLDNKKRTFENGQLESVSEVIGNLKRLKIDARMYSKRKDELQDTVQRLMESAVSFSNKREDPMALEKDPLTATNAQAPLWVPDISRNNCMVCEIAFSFVRRRHHCRGCGRLLCSDCSRWKIPMPNFGFFDPQKSCQECYKKFSSQF